MDFATKMMIKGALPIVKQIIGKIAPSVNEFAKKSAENLPEGHINRITITQDKNFPHIVRIKVFEIDQSLNKISKIHFDHVQPLDEKSISELVNLLADKL